MSWFLLCMQHANVLMPFFYQYYFMTWNYRRLTTMQRKCSHLLRIEENKLFKCNVMKLFFIAALMGNTHWLFVISSRRGGACMDPFSDSSRQVYKLFCSILFIFESVMSKPRRKNRFELLRLCWISSNRVKPNLAQDTHKTKSTAACI